MLSSVSSTSAVDQLFMKVDANHDGKITKGELTQALKSESSQGGSSNLASSVDTIFKLLDTGNKGYFTKQDAVAGLNNEAQASSQAPTKKGDGGGGGGGVEGAGAAAATTNFDPADTNLDGKVSMQEETAYLLKLYQQGDSGQQSKSVVYG